MPSAEDRSGPADQNSTDPRGRPERAEVETPASAVPTQPAAVNPIPEMPPFIGPYRVVAYLGRGGQGSVFRAAHPTLARDVVIKIASRELTPSQQQSLFAEGRVLARLDDPGLIRVFDANVHEGRPYLVFEFVQGRSLADQVRGASPRPRDAVALVAELADILERVHRAGVLHRDLKPTNVLIDAAGRPRLMDFGSALLTAPYTDAVAEEELSGTPSYMSPEQANADAARVGPPSDVFGLAGVLYHLVTGSPPYPGTSNRMIWDLAKTGRVTPATQRNPAVPRALAAILDKALAFDPADRHQSAAEFGRALRGYLRRPLLRRAFLVAAVVGLLATAVAVVVVQSRKDPDPPPVVQQEEPTLPGWNRYEPDGLYVIRLPVEPRVFEDRTWKQGLPEKNAQCFDPETRMGYAVAVSPNRDAESTAQAALRARRDEVTTRQSGKITSEREITYDGHPGVEATATVTSGQFKDYWFRIRVYLIRGEFYSVAIMGPKPTRPDGPEATAFFDSFRLLERSSRTP